MAFKSFRLGLVLRTILLSIAMFATVYSLNQNEWYVTSSASAVISISILINIIRFAEKYKRSLSEFLISIQSKDFVSLASNPSKDILHEAYNSILHEFQNIRIEKEIHYQYLKTMVEHIKTALFSFDQSGNIDFINKTASLLLNLNVNQNIKKLELTHSGILYLIQKLKSGENELIKIKVNNELMHLSVYATELKIQSKKIKLISLQNIKQELEYQELESWQKLIRVLTHEIMNSVTPISSLSEAINDSLNDINCEKDRIQELSDQDFDDMLASLKTIENRSKGLLKFVSSYKKLTRIPKPDLKQIDLVELTNHCITLLKKQLTEYEIFYEVFSQKKEITTYADYDQIEQVVINLLINAIDAVKDTPDAKITIHIIHIESKQQILIKDNGNGISPDELDKIFIPFYTTKKDGSGIGLSISRQIMQQHKGSIYVNSDIGSGTEFILEF
mgnify:CR=1 FL=1